MKASNKTLLIILGIILLAFVAGVAVISRTPHRFGWIRILKFSHHHKTVVGNGDIIVKQYKLPDFKRLAIGGEMVVDIVPGKSLVAISADQNLMPYIKAYVLHKRLHISSQNDVSLSSSAPIRVKIFTNKPLVDVATGGTVKLTYLHIAGEKFELVCGGVGHFHLAGKVYKFYARLAGASKIYARDLVAQKTSIKVAGTGEATVNVKHRLRVVIAGAGKVRYLGHPKTVSQRIVGFGKVEKID